ncbi:MAG: hypothetical protein LBO00_09350 [Zoogloeaceae bacterium]|jgi:hypothetical protein|nr:hypothetical protein [Zoogloeaceae bacterium]
MAYVLEKIAPEDLQKIISDADAEKQSRLRYAQKEDQKALTSYRYLPTHWAIDRERNCYVLMAPKSMVRYSGGQPYYLFSHGHMYKFRRAGICGFQFHFDGRITPPAEELLRAQQEFELALRCHGTHGDDGLSCHENVANITFLPPLDSGE